MVGARRGPDHQLGLELEVAVCVLAAFPLLFE
jgi:hypothetical protein